MAIPSGVILIWTGTNATIPTGWSRETALDDKFPKGHGAEDPNTTGGSNTHTHTSPSHTHPLTAHTHTYTSSACDNNWNEQTGSNLPSGKHTHTGTTDNSSSVNSSGTAVTYASSSSEPPYYTVIFVKPSGVGAPLPAGICAHYYGSSAPALWNFCNGSNSTPDLRDKYLKGASTGADAGTTGGGTSHNHTITHGHTGTAHTHTYTTDTLSALTGRNSGGSDGALQSSHNHTGTSGNSSVNTITDYSGTLTLTDVVEPAYKKLGVIKSTSGSLTKGIVGLWLGTVGDIPANWVLCDGNNGTYDLRDKFVKIGAALSNNNETGGANTHTHAAVVHSHTGASHTHSIGPLTHGGASGGTETSGSFGPILSGNVHPAFNVNATTSAWGDSNTTADSSANQPAYITIAYIQLNKLDGGASFLLNFI